MEDQVDALVASGIRATFSSSISSSERRLREGDAQREYELVYVAPERSQRFLNRMAQVDVS